MYQRFRRVALLAASTLAIAACSAPVLTPQQALASGDASTTDDVAITAATPPRAFNPLAQDSPQARQPAPLVTTAALPPSTVRLDTTSPATFADSLKQMDPTLSPEDQKLLRSTLLLLTMQLQTKISTIAQTYTAESPPQFTDKQLLDMAYGQLNGKTAAEIIQVGRTYAQSLPPEAREAIAKAAQNGVPGASAAAPPRM